MRDLTKVYGTVTAVDRISFTIESGSTVALLGGNGAGKTTTISMLLGLVVPTAGEVRVFGADMSRNRYRVAHRLNFQSPYVDMPMRLTVRQNLTVYAGLYGVLNVQERVAYIAEDLQIAACSIARPASCRPARRRGSVWPRRCSTRRSFCCSTSPPPRSTPTPPTGSGRSCKPTRRSRGATILLASHNMAEVERLADRVILLEAGRIIEDGPPQQLLKAYGRKTLEEVFLHIARRNEGAHHAASPHTATRQDATIAAVETETGAAP